jgi:hypothetical protein
MTLAVEAQDAFDGRFDALWERAAPAWRFAVARDARRLAWRYGDPRGGRSVVLTVTDGAALAGYAVLRPGARRWFLADLLALPGRDDVVRALAATVVRTALGAGATALRCWLPARHPYRRVLEGAGFRSSGRVVSHRYQERGLTFDALSALGDPAAAVHYTIGDTDLV